MHRVEPVPLLSISLPILFESGKKKSRKQWKVPTNVKCAESTLWASFEKSQIKTLSRDRSDTNLRQEQKPMHACGAERMDGCCPDGRTDGLSRLERLMVTHRRYIILERMWDGMGERKGGRNALARSLARGCCSGSHYTVVQVERRV